jgi:hypothetical protein
MYPTKHILITLKDPPVSLLLDTITPPLEEVRGKNNLAVTGCRYVDKPHVDSQLKNHNRRRAKYGYII